MTQAVVVRISCPFKIMGGSVLVKNITGFSIMQTTALKILCSLFEDLQL